MSRDLTRPITGGPRSESHPAAIAVVALGANLGDREQTIADALREIARLPLVDGVVASAAIESVAVTPEGPDASAPAYLNSVALVTTRLAPSVLLGMLHGIEAAHGRERRERWGDRTLDLDLVSHGDVIARTSALVLPHPRAAEREFVLAPWLAIDADAVLPGQGRVDDLLAALRAGARDEGSR